MGKYAIIKITTLNEKEKVFFKDLFLHQSILKSLTTCLEVAENVGLYYKKEGLCLLVNAKINDYLTNLTVIDKQVQLFINLLKEYVRNYEKQITLIYENNNLEVKNRVFVA